MQWQADASVLLCVDLVGFTAMTDHAVERDLFGAEEMAAFVGDYVGAVVGIVRSHGGEVSAIAGDAIWAAWRSPSERLEEIAFAAVTAALVAHRQAALWAANGRSVNFRAALGAGTLRHLRLGGHRGEWHSVFTGAPVSQIAGIEPLADAGQVVLSGEALALLRGRWRGTLLPGGAARLVDLSPDPATGKDASPVAPTISAANADGSALAGAGSPPPLLRTYGGQFSRELANYAGLPAVASERSERLAKADGIAAHQDSEFRTLSVVFLRFSSEASVPQLQAAVCGVQSLCEQFQGALYQALVDERGATIIAVFGLPGMAHEDDASRALRLSLATEGLIRDLGLSPAIGVTTGRMFCLPAMDPRSQPFTIVGPAINLAARLTESGRPVLCDEATLLGASAYCAIDREPLPPLTLKGKREPVTSFAPSKVTPRASGRSSRGTRALIGRRRELALLEQAISRLHAGRGGVVFVEGEAGIGKSMLTAAAASLAEAAGCRCLVGAAEPLGSSSAYYPWREIYRQLFGLDREATAAEGDDIRLSIESTLGVDAPLAPLLEPLLGVVLTDTPDSALLIGEARAERLRRLLTDRLVAESVRRPVCVVLEDMHWCDSGSWLLLERLVEAQAAILFVLSSRPLDSPTEAAGRVVASTDLIRMTLPALSEADCEALLTSLWNVQAVEKDVVALVLARSNGNPFFVVELARTLDEHGIVTRAPDRATIATSVALAEADVDASMRRRGLPATLEGIILARLDRLAAFQREMLRAASVLGRRFSLVELAALVTFESDTSHDVMVDALATLGFVTRVSGSSPARYEFQHAVLRDVTYHATSLAERRRLHRLAADWLSQSIEGRSGQIDAVVGHHFAEAEECAPAIQYLTNAGEQALKAYANVEAARLFERTLTLESRRARVATVDAVERANDASRRLSLAQAQMRLSRYAEARGNAESGLRLMGFPVPQGKPRLCAAIGAELIQQGLPRRRSARMPAGSSPAAGASVCQAFESLVEVYFFMGDSLPAVYSALRTLNLAECLGVSGELARGQATLAGILSFTPLRAVAERYRRRALATVEDLAEPAATVWVSMVVALSLVGSGQWRRARLLLEHAASAARQIGDMRRWRDAVENIAGIDACRGEWGAALDGVAAMQQSAHQDKDRRCLVSSLREQGFYYAHTAQWDGMTECIARLQHELGRGLTAEAAAARQDLLALEATLALEQGDADGARVAADTALAEMSRTEGLTFPFSYWAPFLVTRVFLNLWSLAAPGSAEASARAQSARSACRIVAREASVHAIARPALLVCRGVSSSLAGQPRRARRALERAAADANRLEMPYEIALAAEQLARLSGDDRPPSPHLTGLPLFRAAGGIRMAGAGSSRPL